MNSTISYHKNGEDIKDTYLKIVNNEVDGLKWLVITNDSDNELYVEETGESLKDFVEFLKDDATKVKYGICKTIPPGSDVEKILFIGFCSDYLSIKPKMSFMKNLQIVRDDLFNNYHVLLEIRDESDLNYESISKRLGDAAGARYSIQTGNSKGSLLHSGSSVKLPQRTIPLVKKPSTSPAVSTPKKVSETPKPAVSTTPKPTSSTTPKPAVSTTPKPTPTESFESKSSDVKKSSSFTPEIKKSTPPVATISNKSAANEDDDDDWSEPELEEKEIGYKGSNTTSNWTPIGKVDLKKLIAEEKAKADPRLVKETFKPSYIAKKKVDVPREQEVESIETEETETLEAEEPESAENENIESAENDDSDEEDKPEAIKSEEPTQEPESSEEDNQDEHENEEKETDKNNETKKTESDRKADIEAYLAKMSKKSISSDFGSKKTEDKSTEPAPVKFTRSTPEVDTDSKTPVFNPPIIKPRPMSFKKEASPEQPDEQEKVSKQNYKKFGVPLPGLHVEEPEEKSEKEDSDDGWSDDEDEKPAPAPRAVPALPQRTAAPQASKSEESADVEEEEESEDKEVSESEEKVEKEQSENEFEQEEEPEQEAPVEQPKRSLPPPPPSRSTSTPPKELKAKALYEYEAAESNEISFRVGEIITNIDKKFEEWWIGENENGESGCFPCSYVELI